MATLETNRPRIDFPDNPDAAGQSPAQATIGLERHFADGGKESPVYPVCGGYEQPRNVTPDTARRYPKYGKRPRKALPDAATLGENVSLEMASTRPPAFGGPENRPPAFGGPEKRPPVFGGPEKRPPAAGGPEIWPP